MGEKQLSAVEAELYDRQIRLWGIESQERLRAANILLIGIRGLGSEIAKNILLSGINSLTILDDGTVTEDDFLHNFLINRNCKIGSKIAEEVLNKAQALNPLVKITVETNPLSSKDDKYFETFTIIVGTGMKLDEIIKIDDICRNNNVKFICGDVFGTFGYSLADFQDHEYFEDVIQLTGKKRTHDGAEKTTVKVKRNINYPSLNKVLNLEDEKKANLFKRSKRINNLFVFMLALIEFKKEYGRSPDIKQRYVDINAVKAILKKLVDLSKISNFKFDDFYELIFGEVVPVCAIVGGVIAQEVIKAVSHKEVPINNTFLFDPLTYSGTELTVSA